MNCYDLFLQKFNKDGNIVFYNHKTKLSKIATDIQGICASFQKLGLKKGDVISLYLPTCPQSIVLFYACSKSGVIANFIHPRMSVEQVCQLVKQTNSKLLFFFDALVNDERKLQLATNQQLVRCSVADYETALKPFFSIYSKGKCKRSPQTLSFFSLTRQTGNTQSVGTDNDIVCYMHSGGTSGEPKIVALTNKSFNYVATNIGILHNQPCAKGKYALVTLPVFHAYGLCASIHAPLLLGYGLALVPKFDISQVNTYLNTLNVGLWLVVPTMIRKMLQKNAFNAKGLKNIQDLWCGGDFVDETLLTTVNEVLAQKGSCGKALRGYGLTETCGACTVSTHNCSKIGSCGKPIDGTKIVAVDEFEKPLPYGVTGELVICSDAVSSYLNNASPNNFLKSGDMGYIDQDGFVYVVDRKKRIVKIASVNVFPSEIEQTICQLPFVKQCCVVGYKESGKQFLAAYVVLNGKNAFDIQNTVKQHCHSKLSLYSVPQKVQVLPSLPLTPFGKVDYLKLQKLANGIEF